MFGDQLTQLLGQQLAQQLSQQLGQQSGQQAGQQFGGERERSPRRGGKGGGGMKNGDWYCPQCNDHQFARNPMCRNCGAPRPEDPSLCGPPDPATFLQSHVIDDKVLNRFLALTPKQQEVVIRRGSLNDARDPSAVLSSRISQVLQGGGERPTPGGMSGTGVGVDPAQKMMMQMMTVMMKSMGMTGVQTQPVGAGGQQMPRSGDWYCPNCGDHQFAKNAMCRNCGTAKPTDGSANQPPDIEMFLAVHQGLEEHVVTAFRSLDPQSQKTVIARGSLNGTRDPSAVLMTRVKEARNSAAATLMGSGVPGNRIQPSGSDWYCPNCYDLQFKNNELCRICGTSRELGLKDISLLDPEYFLRGHAITPEALGQFNNLPQEQKQMVMSGGSLHGARDPSAVLINRMVKARSGGGGGQKGQKGGGKGFVSGGDWFCRQCGDHQFARNSMCRNCGAPKPTDGSQFSPPEAQQFLDLHPVEDHARDKFLSLTPDQQTAVITKGSLAGARDPTAVLMTRIREVSGGGSMNNAMSSMGMGGGDDGGDMQAMMMQQMMQMVQQAQQQGGF